MNLNLLWGKYSEDVSHPLLCHMIDVASVARALLETLPEGFRTYLSKRLGFIEYHPESFVNFTTYLIAMHDIGKASPGFQLKVPELAEPLKAIGLSFPYDLQKGDHSHIGQCTLPQILESLFEMEEEIAGYLSIAVTSHHGTIREFNEKVREDFGDAQWDAVRYKIAEALRELFDVTDVPQSYPSASALIYLAGLCSVADWIGSSEENFPYHTEAVDLEKYFYQSVQRAKNAVDALQMKQPEMLSKTFADIFPSFQRPNPVQKAAIDGAMMMQHPMLMIVEAPMGEGKTEAALGAYAQIASRYPLRGFYFALPTQATGNMMLPRIENFLQHYLDAGAELHLLHGNADLNEAYRQLRARAVYDEEGGSGLRASGWFTARKRGLLADYGVGTIDQALVGALRSKHLFVRIYGLSSKVLIIDEVHAYDAYMSGLLEVLLSWLARLNTSVILLSATLPLKKRRQLMRAFNAEASVDETVQYPCVTTVGTDARVKAQSLDGLKSSTASIVPLPLQNGDFLPVLDLLGEKLADGGCAACIVNTVAQAQALYEAVKTRFPEDDVLLFHARFTLEKRLETERNVIERYGKNGSRPHRGIVVATQVIEQSLDIDFDIMLSALAPIDLVLQRLGRLHRHERKRPIRLKERILYLMAPETLDGTRTAFGVDGYVYYPAILYKSASLFYRDGAWQTLHVEFPGTLSKLVEAVYDEDFSIEAIEQWEREQEGKEGADLFVSRQYAIPFIDGFRTEDIAETLDGMNNRLSDDPDEPAGSTRLGTEGVQLVIVPRDADLRAKNRSDVRRFYAQSVRVQTRWVVEHFKNVAAPKSWQEEPLLRYCKSLYADEVLHSPKQSAFYDPELGFFIQPKGGEDDL